MFLIWYFVLLYCLIIYRIFVLKYVSSQCFYQSSIPKNQDLSLQQIFLSSATLFMWAHYQHFISHIRIVLVIFSIFSLIPTLRRYCAKRCHTLIYSQVISSFLSFFHFSFPIVCSKFLFSFISSRVYSLLSYSSLLFLRAFSKTTFCCFDF